MKRATTLYTATAAFLVFIGVTSLFMLSDTERELRKQLTDLPGEPASAALAEPGVIRSLLIFLACAVLVVAIGHGLTAQALRDRRPWARPVGFTFSGILAGVAVLGTIGGAVNIQTLFYLVAGLSGILALAKPQVRDYLRPFPKARPYVPGPFPPGPPNGPQPPGGPWPPNAQQPPNGPWAPHDQQPSNAPWPPHGEQPPSSTWPPYTAQPPHGERPERPRDTSQFPPVDGADRRPEDPSS